MMSASFYFFLSFLVLPTCYFSVVLLILLSSLTTSLPSHISFFLSPFLSLPFSLLPSAFSPFPFLSLCFHTPLFFFHPFSLPSPLPRHLPRSSVAKLSRCLRLYPLPSCRATSPAGRPPPALSILPAGWVVPAMRPGDQSSQQVARPPLSPRASWEMTLLEGQRHNFDDA